MELDVLDEVQATRFERVLASPALRRVVPLPAAHALIGRVAPLLAARGRLRHRAIEDLTLILEGTSRAGEVEGLVAPAIRERLLRLDLLWRHWVLARSRVEGLEHLRAAGADGHGVLIVFNHVGPWFVLFPALRIAGIEYGAPVWNPVWTPSGLSGLALQQHRRYMREVVTDPIAASGSGEQLARTLLEGGIVTIATDVRGRTPTRMLERTVWMTSGSARLVAATGARVIPAQMWLRGDDPVASLGPPLQLGDAADVATVHAAIAGFVGGQYLERPEAVDQASTRPLVNRTAAPPPLLAGS